MSTKAPHNCAANGVHAMAFEEATKIAEGHDVVEEFLAYSILPLSDDWDLEVESMEAPLSKVTIPMSKVASMISEQETEATFETRIACTTTRLVGNYGPTEHHACIGQLHHGRLNNVFELAGVKYSLSLLLAD
jgi:hypothetical protein